jgi:hypothetical protein
LPTVGRWFDWDVEEPGSRFSPRPALTVHAPESEWPDVGRPGPGAEGVVRARLGDWALEPQESLGTPEALEGSTGRGTAGWTAVVEFVTQHAAGGVISAAAGMAFKRFWRRAREAQGSTNVSRGGAVYLAVAEVAERFGLQESSLEVEAAEEPSSIAGHDVTELSYTGFEPWVVLLRHPAAGGVRYVLVVAPDGEIFGVVEAPLTEGERLYLRPVDDSSWAGPSRRRRRWFRRR